MKKVLMFLVAMAICSVNLFAGDVTRDIKVSSFSKLNVSYCFDVTVEKSADEYLTITIDEEYEPYLNVKVRDGVLFIGIDSDNLPKKLRKNNSETTFIAKVGVKNLHKIEMSGATSFYSDEVFSVREFKGKFSGAVNVKKLMVVADEGDFEASGATKLNLEGEVGDGSVEISGASSVSMNVISGDMEVEASGASNVNIEGEYGELDVECSGASNAKLSGVARSLGLGGSGASKLKAEDMKADYCEVDFSGASSGSVNAIRHLEVDLSGASKLVYNGNVQRLELDDISSGSSLKKR